jgi:glycosyltransferase involved in cell wall biosynthesis
VEAGRNLYGGALQVRYLLDALRAAGATEDHLACPPGSEIGRACSGAGHAVHEVAMGGDADPFLVFRLRALIRRIRPHVVHLHSRRGADLYGGIAARLASVPCLLTRRVDNPEPPAWARVKYRLFDRVAAISEGIRAVLLSEGVPPGKVETVRSVVDAEAWSGPFDREAFRRAFALPPDAPALGVVAQLIERKGHRVLLRAAPAILSACPEARFLFFGKGPLEGALREEAAAAGLLDRVLFAGFREDLPKLLGCLDLVVHPALMEGLGVSLLQAAAAGVPVVGSDAGGIPEAVLDGVTGRIVPPGEAEPLAAAVTALLRDPAARAAMGEAGRRRVREEFSAPAMAAAYLRIYREMAGAAP